MEGRWMHLFSTLLVVLFSFLHGCDAFIAAVEPLRIDCGSDMSSVVDGNQWLADAYYEGGEAFSIPDPQALAINSVGATLRAFPAPPGKSESNAKGCYDVPRPYGRYLVRVGIAYHNYDGNASQPFFDITLNNLRVETVIMASVSKLPVYYNDYLAYTRNGALRLCVIQFDGVYSSPPQLNSLEIFPIDTDSYEALAVGIDAALSLVTRTNYAGPGLGPEPEDPGYRLWSADVIPSLGNYSALNVSTPIAQVGTAPDMLPEKLFQTAREAFNGSTTGYHMGLSPLNPQHLFMARLHFAEIVPSVKIGDRRMDVILGEESIFSGKQKAYLDILEMTNGSAFSAYTLSVFFNFSTYAISYGSDIAIFVSQTPDSKLPPIVSGFELYEIVRAPPAYKDPGMSPSAIALTVVLCVAGGILIGIVAWVLIQRNSKQSSKFAIIGAGTYDRV